MTEVRRYVRITQTGRTVNVRRHHRDTGPEPVIYDREGEPETWTPPDDATEPEPTWGDEDGTTWAGYEDQDDDQPPEMPGPPHASRNYAAPGAQVGLQIDTVIGDVTQVITGTGDGLAGLGERMALLAEFGREIGAAPAQPAQPATGSGSASPARGSGSRRAGMQIGHVAGTVRTSGPVKPGRIFIGGRDLADIQRDEAEPQ